MGRPHLFCDILIIVGEVSEETGIHLHAHLKAENVSGARDSFSFSLPRLEWKKNSQEVKNLRFSSKLDIRNDNDQDNFKKGITLVARA